MYGCMDGGIQDDRNSPVPFRIVIPLRPTRSSEGCPEFSQPSADLESMETTVRTRLILHIGNRTLFQTNHV